MKSDESSTLRIDALSHGRAAVARDDGKVVFVEGGAPGDLVRARLVRDRGAYAQAEVVEILEPGSARVAPPCPIVEQCGGCCWQHVAYPEQLRAKHAAVVDAFTRIAGIAHPPVEPVVASPLVLGYRTRLRLRFDAGRLGFYRARSHSLVPITDCLIAEDRIRAALSAVETFVAGLDTRVMRVEVASRGALSGLVLAINAGGRFEHGDAERVAQMLRRGDGDVRGVVMWGRGWRREWGAVDRSEPVEDGLAVDTRGASFGQVNREANRLLVAAVLDAAAALAGLRVLDLYAGAGNFSLPFARRARTVMAVEADARAVAAGRACAERHGLRNVEFHAQPVESFLRDGDMTREAFDLVLANPPRDGLGAVAHSLARLRPPTLVYVSCDPATLARDFKVLAAAGYELVSVRPFDMFPHTFHVESVCHARLT